MQERKAIGRPGQGVEARRIPPGSPDVFSRQFCEALIAAGLPPDRLGDALLLCPEGSGGRTVHDLMGYESGQTYLAMKFPEVVAEVLRHVGQEPPEPGFP